VAEIPGHLKHVLLLLVAMEDELQPMQSISDIPKRPA